MNKTFILGAALLFAQKNQAAINKDVLKIYQPQEIVVAVIDSGADLTHNELKDFIWTNEGESGKDKFGNDKEINGIDDDDNGFVDDVHGWNFIKNNNDVSDQAGHGTHVSGIIKNEFNRRTSTSTSPHSVRLMILKYFDPDGKSKDNLLNSTKAIEYANRMKAHVINYSGGGADTSARERLAIQQSAKQNILFIAAAGNKRSNTDIEKYYPANYPIGNIISVAATNNQGKLVSFSNFGSGIDIAAPGQLIYSSLPNKQYGFMSGTSQATAYVSGVVASLLAVHFMPPQDVLLQLKKLGTFNETLKGKTKTQLALIAD
jgi:subtilisin family serine protease